MVNMIIEKIKKEIGEDYGKITIRDYRGAVYFIESSFTREDVNYNLNLYLYAETELLYVTVFRMEETRARKEHVLTSNSLAMPFEGLFEGCIKEAIEVCLNNQKLLVQLALDYYR